jgi:FkbM family methyltransferase
MFGSRQLRKPCLPMGLSCVLVALLAVLAIGACRRRFDIRRQVSAELLLEANHGRDIFRADGRLDFAERVKRVWVDVGAHRLETTLDAFKRDRNLGLVAIEPQSQCWSRWPKSRRLAGIPVAIYLERGTMDFFVNANDQTSSLSPSRLGTKIDEMLKTEEVRKVPVLRLEDVLNAIPAELDIDYLKTDVQGVDLQVIQSAGEQLRRVRRVRVEIINARYYEDVAGHKTATETEMVSYMTKMGFRFAGDHGVVSDRDWLDQDFVNTQRPEAPTRAY